MAGISRLFLRSTFQARHGANFLQNTAPFPVTHVMSTARRTLALALKGLTPASFASDIASSFRFRKNKSPLQLVSQLTPANRTAKTVSGPTLPRRSSTDPKPERPRDRIPPSWTITSNTTGSDACSANIPGFIHLPYRTFWGAERAAYHYPHADRHSSRFILNYWRPKDSLVIYSHLIVRGFGIGVYLAIFLMFVPAYLYCKCHKDSRQIKAEEEAEPPFPVVSPFKPRPRLIRCTEVDHHTCHCPASETYGKCKKPCPPSLPKPCPANPPACQD